MEIELKTLSDLTGDPHDRGKSLPQEWQTWIKKEIEGTHFKQSISPMPPGVIGMLVYKTTIVVRTQFFLWQLVKLSVIAWVIQQTQLTANATKVSVGISLFEIAKNLKNSIIKLNENLGEHCTYVATSKTNYANSSFLKPTPATLTDIWNEHQSARSDCPITTCHYHKGGCTLLQSELNSIVSRLERQEVIKHQENNTWTVII